MTISSPGPARSGQPTLASRLAQGPVLLDGGLATQLEAQGADLSSALWSAQLLLDDPAAIVAAHKAFFGAGAQMAITASYQAPLELVAQSVTLAQRARDEFAADGGVNPAADARELWIAGSVGPYGASLADGSEYRGNYGISVAALRAWHRPRIAALIEAGADVLALETVPCLAEVEALLAEVYGTGIPCWLSLTCVGDQTRAGEPAATGFAMAHDVAEVVAVGVNCVDPTAVTDQVRLAAAASGKPGVAYPNGGEVWDPVGRCWTGPRRFDPATAAEWVAAGARLVGGCCRVTPADLSRLALLKG